LMRRALRIDEQSYGENHPSVATALNNLAQLLKTTNQLAEAEPLMRRALKIDEQCYGENNPCVAIRLSNLAGLLLSTNRLAEAELMYRRALEIDEQSYGENHTEVATDLNNLAQLFKATNRLVEAEPLIHRVVTILLNFTRETGHPHPHLQPAVSNYVGCLQKLGCSPEQIRNMLADLGRCYGIDLGSAGAVRR
jgi:tetratricopeptide (TPR) repeat protein